MLVIIPSNSSRGSGSKEEIVKAYRSEEAARIEIFRQEIGLE